MLNIKINVNNMGDITCKRCGISMSKRMLHRTGPIGEDPEWMCMPCIKRSEPELARDIEGDDDMELLNLIEGEVLSWGGKHGILTEGGKKG